MEWGIAQAKQRFSELIQASLNEPQPIYKREQLTAFVVKADLFQEFLEWRQKESQKSIADAFIPVRQAAIEDNSAFEAPSRVDRANPFIDDDVFV